MLTFYYEVSVLEIFYMHLLVQILVLLVRTASEVTTEGGIEM